MMQGSQNKKNLNVELNLLPVFDVLSVCICFLLMTVVWIDIRALETKQAFGSQSAAEGFQDTSVWMRIDEHNNLLVTLKPKAGAESTKMIAVKNGGIDFQAAKLALAAAAAKQAGATHILPSRGTKYEEVIRLMDISKQVGIHNIGLSPI